MLWNSGSKVQYAFRVGLRIQRALRIRHRNGIETPSCSAWSRYHRWPAPAGGGLRLLYAAGAEPSPPSRAAVDGGTSSVPPRLRLSSPSSPLLLRPLRPSTPTWAPYGASFKFSIRLVGLVRARPNHFWFTWCGQVMLQRVHPSRPDWYEEFYASAMDQGMKSYEAEVCNFVSSYDSTFPVTYWIKINESCTQS